MDKPMNGKRTTEYIAYCGMLERCGIYKGRNTYVEKGIKIHLSWLGPDDYDEFYNHIGPKPSPELVLDRINNSGNYCPGNVRWATRSISNKNKSNAKMIAARGKTMNLIDWSREVGLSFDCIRERIKRGWTEEQALFTPLKLPNE